MNEDPFADFQKPTSNSDPPEGGSVFVFDLETVPDESRFPRPVRTDVPKRADAAINLEDLIGKSIPSIKSKIPILSEAQLIRLGELEERSAKPRSGIRDAVNQQLAEDNADPNEASLADWRKLSFNPFCCRIVALGIEASNHSVTMLAKNLDEERALLHCLWRHIESYRVRCGYNITAFDDAVVIARSMILGVGPTMRLDRRRYGSHQSIDLMTLLFPTGTAMKLKELCRCLGIVPEAGYEMSGDKVLDLVDTGDWYGIAKYVHSDAVIEFELYRLMSDYILFS